MLKQSLQQKLLQKLSPQQIQMIKLLELPTLQLEQRIKKEIEENPALEEASDRERDSFEDNNEDNEKNEKTNDDDFDYEDLVPNDDDIPNYKLNINNYSKDDERPDYNHSAYKSFHDYLFEELRLKGITKRQEIIAEFIIGNIDEDGYLRRDIESISDDIAFTKNITIEIEELEEVLKSVQELDPPGVGATDLQSCLLIQLNRLDQNESDIKLATSIIQNHFEEFTKKHYTKIIDKYNITKDELKDAINRVLKLNPKPGFAYEGSQDMSNMAVIPDFILDVTDNEILISINSRNTPELKINTGYSEMFNQLSGNNKKADKEASAFLKQKLETAKWFIDAIKQRENTLLVTINAIVEHQKDFFLEGDERHLKPMILKDIAEKTNLDISTISRVANSKYVQTPYGNFLLKYFFSEGMQTESGEEVSTKEIKHILKDFVEKESKNKPLTDEKLSELLHEKGYKVARRTVAKYREQLGIPVARLRKEI